MYEYSHHSEISSMCIIFLIVVWRRQLINYKRIISSFNSAAFLHALKWTLHRDGYGKHIVAFSRPLPRVRSLRKTYTRTVCSSDMLQALIMAVRGYAVASLGEETGGRPPRVTPARGWHPTEKKMCGWIYTEQWTKEVGQVKRSKVTPSRGWNKKVTLMSKKGRQFF